MKMTGQMPPRSQNIHRLTGQGIINNLRKKPIEGKKMRGTVSSSMASLGMGKSTLYDNVPGPGSYND